MILNRRFTAAVLPVLFLVTLAIFVAMLISFYGAPVQAAPAPVRQGVVARVNLPGTVMQGNGVTVYLVNIDDTQFAVASGPEGLSICQVWRSNGFAGDPPKPVQFAQ